MVVCLRARPTLQLHGFELQREVFKRMRRDRGDRKRASATRGLLAVSRTPRTDSIDSCSRATATPAWSAVGARQKCVNPTS